MAYPVDQRYGLALKFADFSLLPELLALVPDSGGRDVPDSWRDFLRDGNLNLDHVDEEDNRNPDELAEELAADAWRLAKVLEFISDESLTARGNELARLADTPALERTAQQWEFFERSLAGQILDCYFGPNVSIARLLQQAAQRLEGTEWSESCPGVLLVEVQALIELAHEELAHEDQARTQEWPNTFVDVRGEALRAYPLPEVDLPSLELIVGQEDAGLFAERIGQADAISNYYLNDLGLAGMTLTELRATAMLFAYARLLDLRFRLGPVQYLVVASQT